MAINNIDIQDEKGNSYRPMANPDSISEFTKTATRTNIASGDTHRTIFGKICKFFADLGTSAFSGLANNLTTTAAGYGMDARQGPVIQQKIDQINSNLGGFTPIIDDTGKITGYKTTVGADTVFPFKSFISLGVSADNTFDVSGYSDHSRLTADNFIVECPASEYTGRIGAYSADGWTKEVEAWVVCEKSYNPSNGILTLNAYIRRRVTWNYGSAQGLDISTKFYPQVYLSR